MVSQWGRREVVVRHGVDVPTASEILGIDVKDRPNYSIPARGFIGKFGEDLSHGHPSVVVEEVLDHEKGDEELPSHLLVGVLPIEVRLVSGKTLLEI